MKNKRWPSAKDVRALIIETTPDTGDQTETTQAGQTREAVVVLPTARASSSRSRKRTRTSLTKSQHLVDADDTVLPQSIQPNPELVHSDRASHSEWAPRVTYKNRVVTNIDSVVAEKDHSLAFNLAKSVCLPADMERHDHLIELKAIRSATKSMVLVSAPSNHLSFYTICLLGFYP